MTHTIDVNGYKNLFPVEKYHEFRATNIVFYEHLIKTVQREILPEFKTAFLNPRIDLDTVFIFDRFPSKALRQTPYYKAKVNELSPLDYVTKEDVQAIIDLYNNNKSKKGLRAFWFEFINIHPFDDSSHFIATKVLCGLAHWYHPNLTANFINTQWYSLMRRVSYFTAGTGSSAMFDALVDGNITLAAKLWLSYLPSFFECLSSVDDIAFELIYLNTIFYGVNDYDLSQFKIDGCNCETCKHLSGVENDLKLEQTKC